MFSLEGHAGPTRRKRGARLIGLTGTNGSGKGEAAAFFTNRGFAYHSLSDLIREELERRGLPATRDNLIRTGNGLRRRFGPDVLARRVLRRVRGDAVIDSIRNLKEVAFLRRRKGFTLLAVDAPPRLRFERVRQRGRDESAATLEEFMAKEGQEMDGGGSAQQLRACLDAADVRLVNDSSLEEFHKKLEGLL